MESMYRRRAAGRGRRVGGRKRTNGGTGKERRRLIQLAVSAALFLFVYFGSGVFPGQIEVWNKILTLEFDPAQLSEAFSGVIRNWEEEKEQDCLTTEKQDDIPLPELPSMQERTAHPAFGGRWSPDLTAEEVVETAEPLVQAVAQMFSDEGEVLPDQVSFLYYDLGLEETAVPVMGSITSAFGFRDHPVDGEYTFHSAVDIGVETGTDVLAFSDGVVRYIGENDVYGLYLKIDHENQVSSFYAHCDQLLVQKGEYVLCGQVIAKSGETGNATGPHLHFSIEKDGVRLDPAHYLDLV